MERNDPLKFDPSRVETPCFVVDMDCLRHNLSILSQVKERTGCHILLALKCFAMFRVFPLLRETLDGICASSPDEARLGREEFQKEVHAFAAGYSEKDVKELVTLCDHMVFNSFNQWRRFRPLVEASDRSISCGIRVNPEHSEGTVPIYDPCSPGSRLGVRFKDFKDEALDGISGLHFHTLCQQNSDALERTIDAFEPTFGPYLHGLDWMNLGGGHHITRDDYDIDRLVRVVNRLKDTYKVQVYLEPGEAVALNAGVLVSTVLDITSADMNLAIMDTSAATHMPDVLEMPYRPHIIGSGMPGEKAHTYRLGGLSCLSGDTIGEYSFDRPLEVGDRLVFTDMAIYSMVKTNTFNGVRLPSIYLYEPMDDTLELVRSFSYEDFKSRLS